MLKNHLKIAWRSLKKRPFFTFLNTSGLAIGIAGGLLIALYLHDELSYDSMFADAERIHRIDTDIRFGGREFKATETAAPMAEALQRDFPQIEMATRFRVSGSMLVRKAGTESNSKESHAVFADSTFLRIFGLDLLVGDPKTALTDPNTLLLTKTAAEKHFGLNNALGQKVLLNNSQTYTVTGVIEDMPNNSFLREYSVFMAMAGYPDSRENDWGSTNYFTFVKLVPGATIQSLQEPLQSMVERYVFPWAKEFFPGMTAESFAASGNYIRYHTMRLTDIHLYSVDRQTEMSANSSIQNVYILFFIGLFLLILASVNFMNLATAHSLQRAKEVGVRKTLGSKKEHLIGQFLTESGLISFISLLLALVLSVIALPTFNTLSGKSLSLPIAQPFFWVFLLLGTLFLGLLSGSYPAFFMSRFMPASILKNYDRGSAGGGTVRNTLVVFQFAISVLLIIATLVVFQQVKFIQGKDLGFSKEQVLIINDTYALDDKTKTFKEEVGQLAKVKRTTLSGFLPTPSWRSNSSFFREGAMNQESAIQMQTWNVDHDYMETLGMELVAGRDFDMRYASDSTAVIINESALPVLGVDARGALGLKISQDIELEEKEFYTVIGVVKDFHFESLREDIAALGLFLDDSNGSMAVLLEPGQLSATLAQIEDIWNDMAPGQPFGYQFMDDAFNATYEAEKRLGRVFLVFTVLSIFIACLGLFGLAAFNAQKRTKEIGIRKVMGAGVGQIAYRLTTDFLRMVGIAIVISLPIGWFVMDRWLESFTYRIEIAWWMLALAALFAIGIAILTVSYQSIKAALANPVKSLRTE